MKSLEETAKLVGLHRRVIQEYEKAGVTRKPEHRTSRGYLRYDGEDILRLLQVRFYKELGYEAGEIRDLLSAPGYDREKAVTAQIAQMKRRRQRLDDMITIAEAVRDGHLDPKQLTRILPESMEAPFDVLISAFSSGLRAGAEAGQGAEISDESWEHCFGAAEKLLELTSLGYCVDSEPVQNRAAEIHSCLKEGLSSSVLAFYWVGQMLGPETEAGIQVDEAFGPGSAETLRQAIGVYCEQNRDNETGRLLMEPLKKMIALSRRGLGPESEPVQRETENLIPYFRLAGPDPVGLLRRFGEMLRGEAVEEWMGEDREASAFLGEAIGSFCRSRERRD